jgi:hypothetical protein
MRRGVIWMLFAACLAPLPSIAFARQTLTTTTRVNLRAGPWSSSEVERVLPRHTPLVWNGVMADDDGMVQVVSTDAARDTGWIAGEYLVERGTAAGQLHGSSHARACGVLRWPVKTMSDADAGAVNRTPKGADISTLIAFIAPKVRPQNHRANSVEETEFAVSGNVIGWGLEADHDLHLVLADANNLSQTIVLEVPDSSCVTGATTAVRDSIAQARHDVLRALGAPPSGVTALSSPVPVIVTGVGFFDFGHSIGHPPNAFELHPVLSIRFGPWRRSTLQAAARVLSMRGVIGGSDPARRRPSPKASAARQVEAAE